MKVLAFSYVGKGIHIPENQDYLGELLLFIDFYDHACGDYPEEPIAACFVDVDELAILCRDCTIIKGRTL